MAGRSNQCIECSRVRAVAASRGLAELQRGRGGILWQMQSNAPHSATVAHLPFMHNGRKEPG
ncbi:hypothetical protein THIX_90414 [Thiomonas sp. X19]|nr:hypothetical protein THIX_90414 [Thiomonas sp. X19]